MRQRQWRLPVDVQEEVLTAGANAVAERLAAGEDIGWSDAASLRDAVYEAALGYLHANDELLRESHE